MGKNVEKVLSCFVISMLLMSMVPGLAVAMQSSKGREVSANGFLYAELNIDHDDLWNLLDRNKVEVIVRNTGNGMALVSVPTISPNIEQKIESSIVKVESTKGWFGIWKEASKALDVYEAIWSGAQVAWSIWSIWEWFFGCGQIEGPLMGIKKST